MLLDKEAFPARRHVWWNLVSSTPGRIVQVKEDGKAGRFAKAPGESEEDISVPDQPRTASYP